MYPPRGGLLDRGNTTAFVETKEIPTVDVLTDVDSTGGDGKDARDSNKCSENVLAIHGFSVC